TAHGSFLWEPEAAQLNTIVCELSNGQLCGLPDYPFQANAAYPPSGKPTEPPTLSIGDPGSPVQVTGADESASATAEAATAGSTVAGLSAIPMDEEQAAAARSLAAAIDAARAAAGGVQVPAGVPGSPSS